MDCNLVCPGFPGARISWILYVLGTVGPHGTKRLPGRISAQSPGLLHAGRSVASIAHDLQISDPTIYAWRRQDRIDRGEIAGLTTPEEAELSAAKKRIVELELQLSVTTKAVEVLKADISPMAARGGRADRRTGRAGPGCLSSPRSGGV